MCSFSVQFWPGGLGTQSRKRSQSPEPGGLLLLGWKGLWAKIKKRGTLYHKIDYVLHLVVFLGNDSKCRVQSPILAECCTLNGGEMSQHWAVAKGWTPQDRAGALCTGFTSTESDYHRGHCHLCQRTQLALKLMSARIGDKFSQMPILKITELIEGFRMREISPSTRLVSKVTFAAFLRPAQGNWSDVMRNWIKGEIIWQFDDVLTRRKLHPDSLEFVSQNLSSVFRLCPAHVNIKQSERLCQKKADCADNI